MQVFIDNTFYLSMNAKHFHNVMLDNRYNKMLIPAFNKAKETLEGLINKEN